MVFGKGLLDGVLRPTESMLGRIERQNDHVSDLDLWDE